MIRIVQQFSNKFGDAMSILLGMKVLHKRVAAWYRIHFSVRGDPELWGKELELLTIHQQLPTQYECLQCGKKFLRAYSSDLMRDQFHNKHCYRKWRKSIGRKTEGIQ